MSKPWDQAASTFRGDLAAAVSTETLRDLHTVQPWRHARLAARHLLQLVAGVALVVLATPVWLKALGSVLIGLVVFGFTVLLHEVVHGLVTGKREHRTERVLAQLYAVPSGLSQAQFTRWHLDHHDHLGTNDNDPKRAHLTPKRNARWLKALYFTPALFPIYFRAAARATASYPAPLQARIARERLTAIGFHLGVLAALVVTRGWGQAVWLHALPVFGVFPVAFALNRLGQHYDIDPTDPAAWGTLMRQSPLCWDLIYLWSNYHLEHHYFPRVPAYRLPSLRRALEPFFATRGIPARSYRGLLVDWLVRNRAPHTNWGNRAVAAAGVPPQDG